jgi:hypothetical protein
MVVFAVGLTAFTIKGPRVRPADELGRAGGAAHSLPVPPPAFRQLRDATPQ